MEEVWSRTRRTECEWRDTTTSNSGGQKVHIITIVLGCAKRSQRPFDRVCHLPTGQDYHRGSLHVQGRSIRVHKARGVIITGIIDLIVGISPLEGVSLDFT